VAWNSANKIEAYSRLKTLINTGQIELPSHDRLLSELFTLEARPTPTGMTRIAAAGSGHDDLASALAGAIAQLGSATSAKDIEGIKELMHSLRAHGDERGRFGDAVGIPGLPRWPLDRV
jgi:hypothetical protein